MEDMEEKIIRLTYQDKEIIIIPTAHVSKESAELVKEVIEIEKPDSICVELDEGRYQTLQNPKAWEQTDIVQVIKSKRVGFLIANLALSSYQKKIAKNLDVEVGGETIQGIKSAQETNTNLVLADRSIQVTFLRIWRKLGFWGKVKLIFSFLYSSLDEEEEITDATLQEMLQQDMLESVIASMRKDFPVIGQVLIAERDQYLANKIKHAPGAKVVAVMGGAHAPGVKTEIYLEQNMTEISEIPPRSVFSKLAGWIIPVFILGILVYAFTINMQTGIQQLSAWILWNGILAALFTAMCLAHPLSILTSFVAAPFTSLNPMVACGWFTGLVEASIKKPTVKDVQNVGTDIFTVKGFFTNRFLKIILVVIMANIGSTIGTFAAGADILRNLI